VTHRLFFAVLTFITVPACFCPTVLAQRGPAPGPLSETPLKAELKTYDTPYYVIHTDLDIEQVREVALRVTHMAEEYHERTKDFAGTINKRLPFFLFKNREDYLAAGALPGSAGVFMGSKLMAVAGEQLTPRTWHVIQHEGFHQFVSAVIRGDIPVWLNEGLAEYFGESIYTGDGFISGVVPPARCQRIKLFLTDGDFQPIEKIMTMTHKEWNGALEMTNYDQAWSMVQFLAHGEDGKYQAALSGFINAMSHGTDWEKAWRTNFGSAAGFEEKWKDYWNKLPVDSTEALYTRAAVAIFTSYLARATSQKQTFASFDALVAGAKDGKVKWAPEDAIPASLLDDALKYLPAEEKPELVPAAKGKYAQIVLNRKDLTQIVGTFTVVGNRVGKVTVNADELPPIMAKAKELLAVGKKNDARTLVQDGLKRFPDSSVAGEAKQFMTDTAR
jgi:hypothetical protein